MAKKKTVLNLHFTPAAFDHNVEFYVEARPRRTWVEVGGPFNSREAANDFARDYSINHRDVEVQVVVYQ